MIENVLQTDEVQTRSMPVLHSRRIVGDLLCVPFAFDACLSSLGISSSQITVESIQSLPQGRDRLVIAGLGVKLVLYKSLECTSLEALFGEGVKEMRRFICKIRQV